MPITMRFSHLVRRLLPVLRYRYVSRIAKISPMGNSVSTTGFS